MKKKLNSCILMQNRKYGTVGYYWITLRWKITLHISIMTISNEHYGINLCSILFFYHLTRFGYLKIYKNIFRCEEILKIMTFNTHRFSWKSAEKVVFHRFYQTCLIIVGAIIGGEIGEKIGRFKKKKIFGVCLTDFHVPPPGRLPQIPESVAVGGNRWEKLFGGN